MLYEGQELGELHENMQMICDELQRGELTPALVADWLADNHDELVDIFGLTGSRLVLTFKAVEPELGDGPRLYSLEGSWQ